MSEASDNGMRRGGPEKCPRPCGECSEAHHFADPMIGFVEEEPEHPAALAGCDSWWECKHCDAWREYTGDEDDEDGGDCSACGLTLPGHAVGCAKGPTAAP